MSNTLSRRLWTFANPHNFMQLSERVLPWVATSAAVFLVVGFVWSLGFTEADSKHGELVKIMFVHVPAAALSLNIYLMMVVASLIGLIRNHPVSHLAAKAAATVGLAFTVIAIITGALWGVRGWGAAWEWDPRLTSVFVLLFFYIGYLALWSAIENPTKAAELAGILCLFGSVFALLARYSVEFLPGIHQEASLSLDEETNVHGVYYIPLLIMIAGHFLLFLTLLLVGVRTEIRARRLRALRMAEMAGD